MAREFGNDELFNIAGEAFMANTDAYQRRLREAAAGNYELDPGRNMLTASPLAGYLQQVLPQNVGRTAAGAWIAKKAQEMAGTTPNLRQDAVRNVNKFVQNIPLGGASPEKIAAFKAARADDPMVRYSTVEQGKFPTGPSGVAEVASDAFRPNAAQLGGVVAADVATDGLRNIWWFLNAPQAISQLASMQAMHNAAKGSTGQTNAPPIRSRAVRMAATMPAWIATSIGIGNFARPAGYKAVNPSDEDPRASANPLGEAVDRYFLGRTGGILPYEEFRKERPDVSRQEYDDYKNYLFSNKSPIKATLDGIHGPEVTFMGKSVPLLTAAVPAAAAAAGARRGLRLAAIKAKKRGAFGNVDYESDVLKQLQAENVKADRAYAEKEGIDYNFADKDFKSPNRPYSDEEIAGQTKTFLNARNNLDLELGAGALLHGAGAATVGGLGAKAIEQAIIGLKGPAPQEAPL